MKLTERFIIIEQVFESILVEIEASLNASDLKEIKEFIEVGEYGLAFEVLDEIIGLKEIEISAEMEKKMISLRGLLQL
jgi:hypothetical protein